MSASLRAGFLGLAFSLALFASAAPRLWPESAGPVAVVALPFSGLDAASLIAGAGGSILRSGAYAAVAIGDGDAAFRAEIMRRGGLVLSPLAAFGCDPVAEAQRT